MAKWSKCKNRYLYDVNVMNGLHIAHLYYCLLDNSYFMYTRNNSCLNESRSQFKWWKIVSSPNDYLIKYNLTQWLQCIQKLFNRSFLSNVVVSIQKYTLQPLTSSTYFTFSHFHIFHTKRTIFQSSFQSSITLTFAIRTNFSFCFFFLNENVHRIFSFLFFFHHRFDIERIRSCICNRNTAVHTTRINGT